LKAERRTSVVIGKRRYGRSPRTHARAINLIDAPRDPAGIATHASAPISKMPWRQQDPALQVHDPLARIFRQRASVS
jgi:hypothetical protein